MRENVKCDKHVLRCTILVAVASMLKCRCDGFLLRFFLLRSSLFIITKLQTTKAQSTLNDILIDTMNDLSEYIPFAEKACTFLSASPDPYHAVSNSVTKLESHGFVQLKKRDPFVNKIQPGGKYYYTVNKSALVCFAVGPKYKEGSGGFKIIGGHTDSPNLKVKPHSKRTGSGCVMLGVECYGGGCKFQLCIVYCTVLFSFLVLIIETFLYHLFSVAYLV